MLQKSADVLNARSVEHIGVCSTRLRAEWVRNGRGGKTEFGVRAARRFVLAHGRQAACLKRLRQARNDV